MKGTMDPLREEHRELRPHVDQLGELADLLDERRGDVPMAGLEAATAFLRDRLLRHAAAEEAALYPAVGQALGAPEATATMARDHLEIRGMIERLEALVGAARAGRADVRALQRVLYGLQAILGLHFAKEEEVYVPLLEERLAPHDVAGLLARLEAAADSRSR